MGYTAEQLAGMSDYDIEGEIEKICIKKTRPDATDVSFDDTAGCVWANERHCIKGFAVRSYCSDWSATGPLMVEHGICLHYRDGVFAYAEHFCNMAGFSDNNNPLRSICEVILMMGE